MILTNYFCSVIIVGVRFVGDCFLEVLVMSNFYGKRFLSSLLGALSVLGSPVASAVGGKLGKGNLKDEVESSAGRSKNGGKGGKLEVNREVKSVNGLKEVLKETGGKVVRVSPDGKGGFVAFVKTPTGKVVTVTIVGVPLIVVLGLVAHYVFSGRKNDGAKDMGKSKTEDLLDKLFGSDKKWLYEKFVDKLLGIFFNDKYSKQVFDNCSGNLDEFLKSVFSVSNFPAGGDRWEIEFEEGCSMYKYINLTTVRRFVYFNGDVPSDFINFYEVVIGYLSEKNLVKFSGVGGQASWGEKISAVLFGFWCLVEFGKEFKDYDEVEQRLRDRDVDNLGGIFWIICDYVKKRLSDAGRDDDGQKLEPVD